jgi:hypothetical protein
MSFTLLYFISRPMLVHFVMNLLPWVLKQCATSGSKENAPNFTAILDIWN